MKTSIITPTHDPKWLREAWAYLREQPFDEWLLLLNGPAQVQDIPLEIRTDRRVVTHRYDGDNFNVGNLKKMACGAATGDILIELDHDDILMPHAVKLVRDVFTLRKDCTFVSSDCGRFLNDGSKPTHFLKAYGWQHSFEVLAGRTCVVHKTPPETAYHMSLIWFAPDHLRAWRRTAYDAVGGHDETLAICDDLDLMQKLYMHPGRFLHLDAALYAYRIHGDNTWLKRNAEIQEKQRHLQDMRFVSLVEAETERELRIDIGGRFDSPNGYQSVDLRGGDVQADLEQTWPFEDSSVAVVRAHDALEHLIDPIHTMSEIHRVLRPGGYLLSETPSTCGPTGLAGQGAFQDPTHVSFWNRNSFWYYTRAAQAQYIDNETIRFMPVRLYNFYPSQWHKENHIPYVRADLICLKDGVRPHGPLEI